MRLDKYLAHAMIGTRKEVKQMIRKKRVHVNGVLVTKDDVHIQENVDEVKVDGEVIAYDQMVYIMLYKPNGVVSAVRDKEHATVLDCIDAILPPGCFPVGRLDIDTEGLLLITNDGVLSHRLLSPKHHVSKTYFVKHRDHLGDGDIQRLENGSILLDDEAVKEAQVERIDEKSCYITIYEGRYHQVKRMFHAINNEVEYLKRVAMKELTLDTALKCGMWRYLHADEIAMLKKM